MREQSLPGPAVDDGVRVPMMDEQLRADLLLRLKKVNGQVNGRAKMVEQDRYCADVLQQLSAARSALEVTSRNVARNGFEERVADAVHHDDPLGDDQAMRAVIGDR